MIAVVLTLDTDLSLRTIEAVRAALSAGGVPVRVCHARSTLDLATDLLSGRELHTIAMVTEVDEAMDAMLARLARPFVLLHTNPLAAAVGQREDGLDPHLQRVRAVMRQMSSFVAPQAHPACLTIDADRPDAASRLLEALLDILNCRGLWQGSPAMLSGLPADMDATQEGTQIQEGTESGGTEESLMAKGALASFQEMQTRGLPARFVISRLLFCEAKREGVPIAAPLEISGARQLLVYGPYIHLPAGIWHVRMVLEFSPGIQDVPFLVDVAEGYGAEIRARTSFTINVPGRHEVAFDVLHERPAMPIEFRIFSERHVAEGQMALGFVSIERHVADRVADVEGVHEGMREHMPG